MEARSRRWTAIVGVTALVFGVSLGIVVAGGGAAGVERANPPAGSGTGLKKIQKNLQSALDRDTSPADLDRLVKEAIRGKHKWTLKAFGSQELSGCDAGWLLNTFDAMDTALEAAADPRNKEGLKGELHDAYASAYEFAGDVGEHHKRCPNPTQADRDNAKALFDLVASLPTEPPSDEVRKTVAARKALFLSDSRVYGCEATDYLAALERIDIPLAIVFDNSHNEDASVLKKRLVKDAVGELKKFRRYWRKVPCDEPGTGTSTTTSTSTSTATGTQTTTSTTTTTMPTLPACSDGVDNDGDGEVDGGDLGCLSTQDTTEQTNVWPYHYPGDGFSGFDWIDLKPFFGPFVGQVLAYRVFFGMSTVHTSTSINHGSMPINGTLPCPFLGPTGIKAGVGTMAPTGGGLPPAPDSDHLRIVIDTSDPAGGGDCGLGPVDLEVATDTRVP